jgi:23S rRNA (pseudouridine1915-N3)-methyltransferase
MKVRLLCVGSITSNPIKRVLEDYVTRLSHYVDLEIIEVKESKTDDPNEEALSLQKVMNPRAKTIALSLEGQTFTSEAFASLIQDHQTYHAEPLQFLIGGSHGLAEELKSNPMSFSSFTFPHQLMRVIFIEQLYRAFKIIKNEPYHK